MAYATKAWNVCKKLTISFSAMHNEYIASSVLMLHRYLPWVLVEREPC